jgi:hypothetical protein
VIANVNRSLIRLGKAAGSPGACSAMMRRHRGSPMRQHGVILAIRLPMNGGKHLEITLRSVHNLVSMGPSNMPGLSYQVAQLKPIFLNIQSSDARDLLETNLPEFKPILVRDLCLVRPPTQKDTR